MTDSLNYAREYIAKNLERIKDDGKAYPFCSGETTC